ncbi:patatin-like phospholipase family protein [Muricoccus radiodurans]|uniref:patatin-like phospholipase family protein n=1 Tax=Muricoccus radiodurans TaxID=2231721 RepID=UPI003CEC93BC
MSGADETPRWKGEGAEPQAGGAGGIGAAPAAGAPPGTIEAGAVPASASATAARRFDDAPIPEGRVERRSGERRGSGGGGAEGMPPISQANVSAPAIATSTEPKRLNLALQGGGTHGAFTWGVLTRLLEDERIEVDAISGTSAGAINGAMLAQGIAEGGRAGAIAALDRFWREIATRLTFSPLRNTPPEKLLWGYDLSFSVAWQTFDAVTRMLSPYQFNPFPIEVNPLRRVLERVLDEARLRSDPRAPRLYVSATNVRTGKPRVFERHEVSRETLLASACLPNLFRAVEIDGEAYWDGGYLGNPALWPLYSSGGPPDIVVVQVNPITREEIPKTVSDINTRLNEVTFNASLMYEMRAIEFVQRLVDQGALTPPRYQRLFVHLIEDEARMREFGMSTKYNGDWDFLCTLRDNGREAAERWLAENFEALGRRDTVDLRERFL